MLRFVLEYLLSSTFTNTCTRYWQSHYSSELRWWNQEIYWLVFLVCIRSMLVSLLLQKSYMFSCSIPPTSASNNSAICLFCWDWSHGSSFAWRVGYYAQFLNHVSMMLLQNICCIKIPLLTTNGILKWKYEVNISTPIKKHLVTCTQLIPCIINAVTFIFYLQTYMHGPTSHEFFHMYDWGSNYWRRALIEASINCYPPCQSMNYFQLVCCSTVLIKIQILNAHLSSQSW